jgi:hypothetical protein
MNPRFAARNVLVGGFVTLFLYQNFLSERFINSIGWNLPVPSRLILKRIEEKRLPGVPFDIKIEYRQAKVDSDYCITNALCTPNGACYPSIPVIERVWSLTTYKTPEDEILCYCYYRVLLGPTKKSRVEAEKLHLSLDRADGGLESFICDLDRDGVFESMIDVPYSEWGKEEKLLIAIMKFITGGYLKAQGPAE